MGHCDVLAFQPFHFVLGNTSCTYRTKTYPAIGGGHLTEKAFRGNLTEKVQKARTATMDDDIAIIA